MPEALRDRLFSATTYFLLALLLCAFWVSPAPHLHDFGEWLYQAQILLRRFTDPPAVAAFEWAHYPVPNSLAVVLLACLSVLLPPLVAGKCFLSLLQIGWLLVLHRFVARYPPQLRARWWLILFASLALSNFFWTGFVAYELALLLFVVFLLRLSERAGAAELALLGVLIFFAHAMVFLVFALVLLCAAISARAWHWLWALLPSALLALAFILGRTLSAYHARAADASLANWREAVLYKAAYPLMAGPFKVLLRGDMSAALDAWPALYWAGVVANAGLVAFLAWVCLRNLACRSTDDQPQARALRWAALALVIFYCLAPYNFFGLINPAGRVLLPLLLLSCLLMPGAATRFRGTLQNQPPFGLSLLKPLVLFRQPNDWLRANGVISSSRLLTGTAALAAVFSTLTVGFYLALMLTPPSAVWVNPQPAPRASVFEHRQWQFAQARYRYFNIRIFAFAARFDDIVAQRYSGLGFDTALIIGVRPPLPQSPAPAASGD